VIRAGLSLAALAVAGCALGPDYERPAVPEPQAYLTELELPEGGDALWWRGFEDPTLNALIEDALADNLDIRIALSRLKEAEAGVTAARSDLFPTLDGDLQGRVSVDGDGDTTDSADAGLIFGYAPDLFGRRANAVKRARALADSQALAVEDIRRLTAAAVADRYIAYQRSAARLELLDTSLELQSQTLEIVRSRFEAGLSADLDVRRAEADLSRTRAQRGSLTEAQARARYALSALLGRAPEAGGLGLAGETAIPAFNGGPGLGVPADLIRRRPDVAAAEAELIAATAAIGIERADLYPSLRLPGSVSADLGSSAGSDLVASLSAILDIPLLDAGRRQAELDAAEARAQTAALAYERAVINALTEVEGALVSIRSLRDRRDELAKAVTASEQAFDQLNALYREGLATFIDILDAQRTLIASRESYVDSEAALAQAIIALYAALGAQTRE